MGDEAMDPQGVVMRMLDRTGRKTGDLASLATALLVFLAGITGAGPSWAGPMKVMGSFPMVNEIMDGSATSFSIRFDGPVAHGSARLTLVTPNGSRSLRARLGSEPNTLFTAVGALPPGRYELRWQVRAKDGAVSKGAIPFEVSAP